MFEGLVANLLNKYLGKYIQNLDTENLRVGITDGKVELTDLQLKPEALFELDLPIEVKAGYVGKISLTIPWTSLYSHPVAVLVEDVYVLAGPITDRKYDPRKERALQLAIKHKRLSQLEFARVSDEDEQPAEEKGFIEKLTTTIVNNLQVSIQRIHIRYEDKVTNPEHPMSCGIMLKSLTAETTNQQLQPTHIDSEAKEVLKLIQLQAFSVYWNPYLPEQSLVRSKLHTTAWRNLLKNSLDNHRIMEEDFDFMVRPVSVRSRVVFNKDSGLTTPRLLASVMLEEIDVLISRQQFLNMLSLADSFKIMAVNQRYRQYSPAVKVKGNAKAWWRYAQTAVTEEFIRCFSWERIKLHRQNYRRYKDIYKKKLQFPDNENLKNQLELLENVLDIANILMAREQAKLEFAADAPNRVERKKPEQGWLGWMWGWGDTPEDEEDEEIVVLSPTRQPGWLRQLTSDEKERLYRAIGYDANENIMDDPEYVAHRVDIQLMNCCFSLVNYSKEVLKVTVTNLSTSFENRPDHHSYRVSLKTESFVVEGVSIEQDLVPLITSDIGVYAPSINQVFSLEFEVNPVHVDADLALKLNVQPVEIVYDNHAVTEMIAFFQVPQVSVEDVIQVMYMGWNKAINISRAGLQYAIEQHKTIHMAVNMKSPYVVIPEFGTLHRGGNVIIIDLGKLKIESELQPKHLSLHECTMSEIESRLYDKFNITITDVKVLLADSGEDWHTAQTQPDSEFHILPSVAMQLAFFNTVKSDYKQLPQQKLEAKISTLKLSLSDEKIQMVADFFTHIPMPHSNSMMGLDDSVDGHLEPILYTMVMGTYNVVGAISSPYHFEPPEFNEKEVQLEPTFADLRNIKRAVRMNSVLKKKKKGKDHVDRSSVLSTESENYFSASDHSDEEITDWAKALDIPAVDDNTSSTNTIKMLLRFVLGEVLVQISKSADKIDTPYLMLRVDRLCVDAAVTVFGIAAQASLGGIQLVDKIHTGPSGEYLEILSNKASKQLISVIYREVSSSCPEFDSAYSSIEKGLKVHFSSLKCVFDRNAILYLNSFIQGLILGIRHNLHIDLKRSTSTVLSGPVAHDHTAEMNNSIAQTLFINKSSSNSSIVSLGMTHLYLVVKLDDLDMKLCCHEHEFAGIQIKGLDCKVVMKPLKNLTQFKLTDLLVEDLTENTLYQKILTIEDDKVFDFKLVTTANNNKTYTSHKSSSVDSSIRLRVGRVQAVVLYKFLSELKTFGEPFFNEDIYTNYTIKAQTIVHDTFQDVQEQGTKINLNVDIRAPTLIVPQSSVSTNVLQLQLGDLSLKNFFEDTEVAPNIMQHWDHIYLNLSAVQMLRGKLSLNGNIELAHTIIDPIKLHVDIKRALPPLRSDLGYEITGNLQTINIQLTQQDLKMIFAVMRENRYETSQLVDKVDEEDLTPLLPERIVGGEDIELTTPVVEIETPLLSAPEVSDLARHTKLDLLLEGMVLILLGEEDDPLAPTSPVHDELDALSKFEIGRIDISSILDDDSSLDVKIKLQSVSLDDIREHSNLAVKRLIMTNVQTYGKISAPSEPMVTFEYKKSKEGNQHINLNVDTVRINVCVPYLLMVTRFFINATKTPEDAHNVVPPVETTDSNQTDKKPMKTPGTLNEPTSPVVEDTTITYSGRFRQPEIVLFAEPTDKHSKVLVLKTNLGFDYFCHKEKERLEARVKQLQILSGTYGIIGKQAAMVLHPCDMEFSRSQATPDSPIMMDARLTDVFLHLSSSTIHIFLNAMDMINSDGRRGQDSGDSAYFPKLHHDLWTTKTVSPERWLEPEQEHQSMRNVFRQKRALEYLHLEMSKVQLMFEVENLDFQVPRLCVKTGFTADIQDWSSQIKFESSCHVEVSYFNEQLAVWEPLLEPVSAGEGNYKPWEVLLKLVRAESHPLSCSSMDCSVDKDDVLDGDMHYLMSRVRELSVGSSDTEEESDTEMTVIRAKSRKMRHGSDKSYDSVSIHGSVQGESDSEPEGLINTLSSNLDSIFSSDSSDADDASDDEDDIIDHTDKPVFMTSKGPVQLDSGAESGDEVDGENNVGGPAKPMCNYILINSFSPLHLNFTPQALQVISEITETFTRPSESALISVCQMPGFEIHNQLEIPAKLVVPDDMTVCADSLHNITLASKEEKLIDIASPTHHSTSRGAERNVHQIDDTDGIGFVNKGLASVSQMMFAATPFVFEEIEEIDRLNQANVTKNKLAIKLAGFDDLSNLFLQKAGTKPLLLTPCKHDTNYCVIYQVEVKHGRKIVRLRSPLQVFNHLTVPIEICCVTEELSRYGADIIAGPTKGRYTQLKVLEPEQSYDVPLYVAYHCKLHIAPTHNGYQLTDSGIWWQDLSMLKDRSRYFCCQPQEKQKNPFHYKFGLHVVCEDGMALQYMAGQPKVIPNYNLHIYPPVMLHNLLPYDISFSLESGPVTSLKHGESIPLYSAEVSKTSKLQIQLSEYQAMEWSGSLEISSSLDEFKAITMETESNPEQNHPLSISIHADRSKSLDLHIFSPYWIINKTGLPIQIRAKLRVYNSKWTRKSFSLDTVGISGVGLCHDKERNRKYQFMLQIQMSRLKLTKMVTILPYFLVVNNTPYTLRYMEENESADLWLSLDTGESALVVEVTGGTETPVTITFLPYEHGDAPVKVVNLCEDVFIKLHQKNQSQVSLLSPNQSVLYTWDDPTSERTLMWNVYNRKKPSYPAFISQDGSDEVPLSIQTVRRSSVFISEKEKEKNSKVEKERPRKSERRDNNVHFESSDDDTDDESAPVVPPPKESSSIKEKVPLLRSSSKPALERTLSTRTDKVLVYWVSFLDGLQRTLLFTQDDRIARKAKKMNEAEQASLALFMSLSGVGVSVVNARNVEVAYGTLSSAPAMWEVEVRNKWKTLNMELASWLEEKWRNNVARVYLEDFLEADLVKMEMRKPFMGSLRRTYHPGLWLEYRQSSHHTYVHARVHRLQVDNQLPDAYFTTVLYPSPIPSYMVKRAGPKPFLELALMRRRVTEQDIDSIKFFKVLIQEFNIQLDKGFLLSLYDIIASRQEEVETKSQLKADLTIVHRSLKDLAAIHAASRPQRIVFEYLHLSPIKLHISFSLDGRAHLASPVKHQSLTSDMVDFFLNSVGATFTEIKQVELRMAYFERRGCLLTIGQLQREVIDHYTSQAVQQAYVLLLGLDVLGNPYGLVKDFTQGLGDFFYEPVLGTMQGPDKFTDNLVRGIRSLLGHTIGGLAGSVSLITGSLGKSLAVLSFDKDYQKRRQLRITQRPKHLPEALYNASKGFGTGVVLGISGVIVNPVRGAYEEGVEGFFKGIGKGLLGLLTKPTGGAVDMVSMAFDGIRRAAEMGDEVVLRMRLPRYINPDMGLKPYSCYQSKGFRLLNCVVKGRYAETDLYWAHAALPFNDKTDLLLLTNKRMLMLEHGRVWTDWVVEWEVMLTSIVSPLTVSGNRLTFKVTQEDTGFSLLTSAEREMCCEDEDTLHWLKKKIEQAMQAYKG